MFTSRPLMVIAATVMLCLTGMAQQPRDDDGSRESAYLFCGDNPKGTVPVFVHPCEQEPLKTVACGSLVSVVEQDGDWWKLMFEDQTLAFVKGVAISGSAVHFQPVHPAKRSPGYTTPECVGYRMAKAKGQPPGHVEPPQAIFAPDPDYPESVRRRGHRHDAVGLQLTVDEGGNVIDAHVTRSSDQRLNQSAIDTVRRWKFKAAMKDGKPIAVFITVEVNFQRY